MFCSRLAWTRCSQTWFRTVKIFLLWWRAISRCALDTDIPWQIISIDLCSSCVSSHLSVWGVAPWVFTYVNSWIPLQLYHTMYHLFGVPKRQCEFPLWSSKSCIRPSLTIRSTDKSLFSTKQTDDERRQTRLQRCLLLWIRVQVSLFCPAEGFRALFPRTTWARTSFRSLKFVERTPWR